MNFVGIDPSDKMLDEAQKRSKKVNWRTGTAEQIPENRKQAIRKKLKALDLTQEDLAALLGHKSKTHMSELMNGIKPFTLKDLVIINRLFRIDMGILVPVFLSHEDQVKVKKAIQILDKPKVKLFSDELVLY